MTDETALEAVPSTLESNGWSVYISVGTFTLQKEHENLLRIMDT